MTAEFITPDMVITIRQPWASAIARGWKGVEIRSHRPPALDQWVAIHAAAAAPVNDGVRLCFPAEAAMRRGVIVAAGGLAAVGVVDSISFVLSAGMLALIRQPRERPPQHTGLSDFLCQPQALVWCQRNAGHPTLHGIFGDAAQALANFGQRMAFPPQ